MPRILVTGSADGLGRETARRLVAGGNDVVVHARSPQRLHEAKQAVPGADGVVADLARLDEVRAMAEDVGPCDVVVHNAAVGYREGRQLTDEGVEHVFAVNVLAPYVLTALMEPAQRLIYLSSGLQSRGRADALEDLAWSDRRFDGMQAYCDSKLFDTMLAFAVARLSPDVASHAVEPGWIATKMGGSGAPGDLSEGTDGQVWLAESEDPRALAAGGYWYQRQATDPQDAARDPDQQKRLLAACARVSGVTWE